MAPHLTRTAAKAAVENSGSPKSVKSIDITPAGLQTQEGIARVNEATREFEDSAAALANAAMEFFDTLEDDILHCMEMYEGVADDVHEMRTLIVARRRKQDAFLRALTGQ
jgi:hypothetical protein